MQISLIYQNNFYDANSNKKKELKRVTFCIFRASFIHIRHSKKHDVHVTTGSDWLVRCKICRLQLFPLYFGEAWSLSEKAFSAKALI